MGAKPRWRQVFDKVERAVGGPLEDVVASNRFVEAMTVGIKARRATSATVWRAVHGVTGAALHAVNIPTRDDVRRLNTNLSALAGEIRAAEQNQRSADGPTASGRPDEVRSATVRAMKSTRTPALKPPAADSGGTGTDDD